MQIVEDQEQGLTGGESLEQLHETPERARLALLRCVAVAHRLRSEEARQDTRHIGSRTAREKRQRRCVEPAKQRQECIREDGIWQPRFHRERVPLGHGEATLPSLLCHLAGETGLSHTGLARKEDCLGPTRLRVIERRTQPGHLRISSDEGDRREEVARQGVGRHVDERTGARSRGKCVLGIEPGCLEEGGRARTSSVYRDGPQDASSLLLRGRSGWLHPASAPVRDRCSRLRTRCVSHCPTRQEGQSATAERSHSMHRISVRSAPSWAPSQAARYASFPKVPRRPGVRSRHRMP